MGSGKNDLALGILTGSNTFLAVSSILLIHAVTHDMHDRILYIVYDRLIYLSIFTYNGQTDVFSQALLHITHNTVHFSGIRRKSGPCVKTWQYPAIIGKVYAAGVLIS